MATGFAASTNALLMTTDGTMNSYALDLSANIGMAATSVSGFNSHVMTYLKKNTVVMRKCVMMFTALAGTIFTDVNKQFSACASGASSFQDEQKYAETNIKIILNRSTAFAASLGACLTPVTTLASAKQINRCINLVSISNAKSLYLLIRDLTIVRSLLTCKLMGQQLLTVLPRNMLLDQWVCLKQIWWTQKRCSKTAWGLPTLF